jgi:beta-lactamase class D
MPRGLPRALLCLTALLVILPRASAQQSVVEFQPARDALDASGFDGTILIYDLRADSYLAGHGGKSDTRFIPASTFKVFSSLVALETEIIDSKSSVIAWDGVIRERAEINRDLDLQTAFRLSAVPHYQQLVRRVGTERMQYSIDTIGYGNRDISGGIDRFWLSGGLRISPREQVEFLTRLYHGDLPFSSDTMSAVKAMMVTEQTDDYVLRTKTGWAVIDDTDNTGWWIGWIEKSSNVYVFATVLRTSTPGTDFGAARIAVTRTIFDALGLTDSIQE